MSSRVDSCRDFPLNCCIVRFQENKNTIQPQLSIVCYSLNVEASVEWLLSSHVLRNVDLNCHYAFTVRHELSCKWIYGFSGIPCPSIYLICNRNPHSVRIKMRTYVNGKLISNVNRITGKMKYMSKTISQIINCGMRSVKICLGEASNKCFFSFRWTMYMCTCPLPNNGWYSPGGIPLLNWEYFLFHSVGFGYYVPMYPKSNHHPRLQGYPLNACLKRVVDSVTNWVTSSYMNCRQHSIRNMGSLWKKGYVVLCVITIANIINAPGNQNSSIFLCFH